MNLGVIKESSPVIVLNATRIVQKKIYSFSTEGRSRPDCFVRLPSSFGPDSPIIITVHGITRNPLEHMIHLAPWADKYGAVLVAPIFSTRLYRGYQQLLCRDKLNRADHFLDQILTELTDRLGLTSSKLHFFGFSGGGQFVHRYAMAYPDRVAAAAVAAAGWYTFPDPARAYPLGIGKSGDLEDINFGVAEFLKIRFLALVGTLDTKRDKSLNQSTEICSVQGDTRVERARRWVTAMNNCANEMGMEQKSRLIEIPGVGHSFKKCMVDGNVGERVFEFLFESEKCKGS